MARIQENLHIVAHGERAGSATALQMPAQAGRFVYIRAFPTNTGNVYVGTVGSGITVAAGTSDLTSGYLLDAGDEIKIPLITNLNEIWYICDDANQDFSFLVYGSVSI
jgi:hypothetical protein